VVVSLALPSARSGGWVWCWWWAEQGVWWDPWTTSEKRCSQSLARRFWAVVGILSFIEIR